MNKYAITLTEVIKKSKTPSSSTILCKSFTLLPVSQIPNIRVYYPELACTHSAFPLDKSVTVHSVFNIYK